MASKESKEAEQLMDSIVIDDDLSTVEVIVSNTDWDKFHIDKVYKAYNIAAAKKIFLEHDISVAVCDIEMPMGSGLDLIKWARENKIDTEFVFLTSHEKFDYARQAIEYEASGYVVKPFNADRMEAELTTALQKRSDRSKIRKAAQYEEWYAGSLEYVEGSFWDDVLQQRILADRAIIGKEIERRRLLVDPDAEYRLILIASGNLEGIEETRGKDLAGLYEKELADYAAEHLGGGAISSRIVNYHLKNLIYTAVIAKADISFPEQEFVDEAKEKLKNVITVYISNPCNIEKLYEARLHIEELDKNNVASKGRIFHENDEIVLASEKGHMLDQEQIRLLLNEKKKKELLNLLKFSMESLAAQKKLSAAVLTEIKQDLLQIVFVYLHSKEIQANQLFANEAFVSLEDQATESLVNMMRYQVHLISRTIDYVSEVEQSDSIVQRAKKYVHDHYKEDISRTEVAESVFLTPEYMAKMFKKETGISLKQYISDYRISVAKELLASPGARISDVASEVGFDNFSYFSTVFKKTTGYTPNEYQAMATGQDQ
ncbi:response regulator transcription factor [Butyrivibrio sp. FCS014]|uniref:response regulator transcription factor n=1 Tax=Butyrivibrio sp. FCS014 TaxID=1408304 RepID=UPI00046619DB|nr:helix-turn-helix domain-containing protein [Butyrivibrio sp. FCS014]